MRKTCNQLRDKVVSVHRARIHANNEIGRSFRIFDRCVRLPSTLKSLCMMRSDSLASHAQAAICESHPRLHYVDNRCVGTGVSLL